MQKTSELESESESEIRNDSVIKASDNSAEVWIKIPTPLNIKRTEIHQQEDKLI